MGIFIILFSIIPSSVIKITKALSSLIGTNSICFKKPSSFGASTIPAQSSKPDNKIPLQLHIWSKLIELVLILFFISLLWELEIFFTCNKPSTKNLRPKSVGILPDEVWLDFKRPASWRSYITFLTEAGDNFSPIFIDSFLDPTGFPSFKKSSTISLKFFLIVDPYQDLIWLFFCE